MRSAKHSRIRRICLIRQILAVCLLAASASYAAVPGAPEGWNGGATAGWRRQDPLNGYSSMPLNNPSNYLQVVFGNQAQAFPEVHFLQADVGASGGAFAGPYWTEGITNVSFRIYCGSTVPADLRVYFQSAVTSNRWYMRLAGPVSGGWTSYSVSMMYDQGWRKDGGGGSSLDYKEDLLGVAWAGLCIERNKATAQQVYGVDDFALRGASRVNDSDGDGASDWEEFIAGTGDSDPASYLWLEMDLTNRHKARPDMLLKWSSARDRFYNITRSTNLMTGFQRIQQRLPASQPRNYFTDVVNTNEAAVYFYRLEVE